MGEEPGGVMHLAEEVQTVMGNGGARDLVFRADRLPALAWREHGFNIQH